MLRRRVVDTVTARFGPRLTAGLASVALSMRTRSRCVVRHEDGCWVHRYPDGVVVGRTPGGLSPGQEDQVARDLWLHGYEPGRGDVVVDVGAGVGSEVRLLSRLVGAEGRVLAIEAHPTTCRCLRRTVELNALSNVTAVECAIVGRGGTVHLAEDALWHTRNSVTREASGGMRVNGCTLSDVMASFDVDRIDLLKINIEGAEREVIEQSAETLGAVRHLVVSCHDFKARAPADDWMRTCAPVQAVLRRAGYVLTSRPTDPRPWVRNYVYASRRG